MLAFTKTKFRRLQKLQLFLLLACSLSVEKTLWSWTIHWWPMSYSWISWMQEMESDWEKVLRAKWQKVLNGNWYERKELKVGRNWQVNTELMWAACWKIGGVKHVVGDVHLKQVIGRNMPQDGSFKHGQLVFHTSCTSRPLKLLSGSWQRRWSTTTIKPHSHHPSQWGWRLEGEFNYPWIQF